MTVAAAAAAAVAGWQPAVSISRHQPMKSSELFWHHAANEKLRVIPASADEKIRVIPASANEKIRDKTLRQTE